MRRHALLGLLLIAATGCTISYPSLNQTGGVNIRPENGRILRPAPAGGTATVYLDVVNTGGSGDTLTGVLSEVAGRAELRDRSGRLREIRIPAAATVPLASDARHVELYDLKRPLKTGDVIIVTLLFEKSGAIGVITAVQ